MVCRVSHSIIPGVPEFDLTLNPDLAAHLNWCPVPNDIRAWTNQDGQIVARAFCWRDGGLDGGDSDCFWGEGAAVILTPKGSDQLVAAVGNVMVGASARREKTRGEGKVSERIATVWRSLGSG
jgi:hypothetical protein